MAGGGGQSYTGLAIFDLHGNELDPGTDSFGESINYVSRPDGKVDVLVSNGNRADRYTLLNGYYVLEKLPKQSQHKPQTQPPKL